MWSVHVLYVYVIWFHLLLYAQFCIAITNPFELTNKAFHFNQKFKPSFIYMILVKLCYIWGSRSGDYEEYYLLTWHIAWYKLTDVSEEYTAAIFRVEE
jgi:hypothetical protein